ncbi:MAG: hypothetical protein M3548_14815 [Actinomycetota bacterium]|nr:hypothetical protein [Actinomycetota bacterium]
MIAVLSTVLTTITLLGALWSLVLVIANKPMTLAGPSTLGLAALAVLLEVGLLVQAVIGFAKLGASEVNGLSFGGYLVGALLILPLAGFWSLAERSRWGMSVLIVGFLSIAVMIVRLDQIWSGRG